MPPLPHQRLNGTAYKLNLASWGNGAVHDRQRLDNLRQEYAPEAVPPGPYPDFHSHVPRTHENGRPFPFGQAPPGAWRPVTALLHTPI
jgi:hypothetical protein